MKRYDYLIVGGGIAGVTAAETIREEDPHATIGIVSAEPHVLYSRVLLPSFLKGKIPREKLFLRTLQDFTDKRIDLLAEQEASFVDVERRTVGRTSRIAIGFKKLLIAAGGRVKPWQAGQGIEKFVHRLQTLEDAERLSRALPAIRNPLVIGASFIALEFIETFVIHRMSPTLLMREPYFFATLLDPQGGELLHRNFERYGISILPQREVLAGSRPSDRGVEVATTDGKKISGDALAVGVGVERNIEFLRGSGLELGNQGIRVNEFLETNQEGIFAAGDIAEFPDPATGRIRTQGNWTNAVLQGKRAGQNLTGKREAYRAVSAYSITNLGFQITALGECDPHLETIVRVEPLRNEYARLFLLEDRIVGAALLNRFADKPHLARLIESRGRISAYRSKLADPTFDLRQIEVIP